MPVDTLLLCMSPSFLAQNVLGCWSDCPAPSNSTALKSGTGACVLWLPRQLLYWFLSCCSHAAGQQQQNVQCELLLSIAKALERQ